MRHLIKPMALVSLWLAPTLSQADEYSFQPKLDAQPIPFVPFTVNDFCRIQGGSSCQEYYKDATQQFLDTSVYKGTVGDYVKYMNDMEALYNKAGETLRTKAQDAAEEYLGVPVEIPTSREELKQQMMDALHVQSEKMLRDILGLTPKENCTSIPEPTGAQNVRVKVPGVVDDKLANIVRRLNDQQAVLCSFGIDLLENINIDLSNPQRFVEEVLRRRDEILAKYNLSQISGVFSMETMEKVQSAVEIAKDIEEMIEAKKAPSPEQLYELASKINDQLPENYQIPDIPNIPAPVPPQRRELELKKRKEWSGFNYGKRARFATYANAYLELRGTEEQEEGTAFGAAGIYILNHEINAIGGYGIAYAGPDKVSLEFEMKLFGMALFPKQKYEESVKIVKRDFDTIKFHYDQAYSQTFMAGPVPVTVAVGGLIDVGIGWEYGVYTTKIGGAVIPYAKAEAYAEGSAGVPAILAVGAAASVTIIDAEIPLQGSAGIKFDEVGYPFLNLGIESHLSYELLSGRAYAFASFLVPRWGLPPWKHKKVEYDIFKWEGMHGKLSIMNWGIEIGRNGTKLTGDLLDQNDRKEAEKIQQAITIEQRKQALVDYQSTVQNKIRDIVQGINKDLETTNNKMMINVPPVTGQALKASQDNRTNQDTWVKAFLDARAREAS